MTPTSPASTTADLPAALPAALPHGLTLDDALRVAAALDAAHAESTRTVYAHAWRVWERWCTTRGIPALPGDPAALAAYLAERAATGTAVASLNMACTAIRHVHRQHGLANPAEHELVRQVRLGLRRTYGTAPQRLARPLTVPEILQITDDIDRSTPIGARDAAIILMGYASAMRGSELVALNLADLELKPGGLLITIRRSKTDQEHHGQLVAIATGCHAETDPVAALTAWLRIRGHQPGPLFSRIWCSRVSDQPLGNHASPGCSANVRWPPASTAPASPPTPCAPATPPPPPSPACRSSASPRRPATKTSTSCQPLHPPTRSARDDLEQGPRPVTHSPESDQSGYPTKASAHG